jgi:hypothetical protein
MKRFGGKSKGQNGLEAGKCGREWDCCEYGTQLFILRNGQDNDVHKLISLYC